MATEKDFVLINYDAGPSFFIGNNAKSTGYYETFGFLRAHPKYERKDFTTKAEKILGKSLKPSEVSQFWFRMAFSFIQEKPIQWVKLQWKKFFIFINNYEKSDNYNYEFMQTITPVLRIGFIPFGVILVLALTSVAIGRWNTPSFYILYLFIIIYSGSVVLFYINSRYRLPLIPALLPFAAWMILKGISSFKDLSGPNKVFVVCILILTCSAAFRPTKGIGFLKAHLNYGGILQASEQWGKASYHYEKALAVAPNLPQVHFNIGSLMNSRGLFKEAEKYYNETIRLQPNHAQAHNNLGVLLMNEKKWSEAEKEFLMAIINRPDYSDAHYNLGIIFSQRGDQGKAENQFSLAKKLSLDEFHP